jgi:hypothetical protein
MRAEDWLAMTSSKGAKFIREIEAMTQHSKD